MICTWIVAALILVIVRLTTWRSIKEVPSGGQNVMEALIEGWEGLIGDILDKRVARWVFPFATTFFIFIVMSNFVDLIPGVGSIGTRPRWEIHTVLPSADDRCEPDGGDGGDFSGDEPLLGGALQRFLGAGQTHFRRENGHEQMGLSAVFPAVHFHRRDGIAFHWVCAAGGAGDASLWQYFCRRNHPGHDVSQFVVFGRACC